MDVRSRLPKPTANRCGQPAQDDANYIVGIITQTFLLLAISHVFHLALKRLGQPTAISQILAGLALGRSGIINIPVLNSVVFPDSNMDYISSTASLGRMLYMFLVGLEIDIPRLARTGRKAAILAVGGASICLVAGAAVFPLVYMLTQATTNRFHFACILMLVFTNTASPILIRMVSESMLWSSDLGRIVVGAALVNDFACLLIVAFVTSTYGKNYSIGQEFGLCVGTVALLGCSGYVARLAVLWLNRRNQQRKQIKNAEVVSLLLFVVGVSSVTEMMGYNSMIASFVLGLVFPREGSTTRTLVHKLAYPVRNVLLPVYIGFAGVSTTVRVLGRARYVAVVLATIVVSTAAKVGGTVVAGKYLGLSVNDSVVLGFLLNVKGHVDLVILGMVKQRDGGGDAFMVLLLTVVVSTLMAGPVLASLSRKEKLLDESTPSGLQHRPPETELTLLACVHNPRDASAALNLVEISTEADQAPVSTHLMHLYELHLKPSTPDILYHQQENVEDDYGGDYARQINVAVDAFMVETKLRIHQSTTVSAFTSMHVEICRRAGNMRASMVIMPFHRFQRVDGKMVGGRDGIRTANINVMLHAPCTVGILVDRGLSGVSQITATQGGCRIGVLFFGGADDREAMAVGARLALHPCVELTVVRFLPAEVEKEEGGGIRVQESKHEEVLMEIDQHGGEIDKDESFISSFYNRFVVSGMVTYEEKFVHNGAETAATIATMEGMYSLFLVGRSKKEPSELTKGMREWEEYPELGPVGDLLASSKTTGTASVLVLQQHNKPDSEYTPLQ